MSTAQGDSIQPHRNYFIRHGTAIDIPQLAAVERSAGQVFRTVGLDAVADDEPMPAEVLTRYMEEGHLWVAVSTPSSVPAQSVSESTIEGDGEVVGFLACFPIVHPNPQAQSPPSQAELQDNLAGSYYLHIAELSVHSDHQRQGLGKRLLDAMFAETSDTNRMPMGGMRGYQFHGYSLTTYRHLSFNAPFYARRGFRELPVSGIEPCVGRRGKELWDEEQGKIVMPEMRCWMVRAVGYAGEEEGSGRV